jgi:hypothetical protein
MMKEGYERYVIPVDLVNTDYRNERRSLKRPALRGVATFPVELDEATVREMLKVQNENPIFDMKVRSLYSSERRRDRFPPTGSQQRYAARRT